MTLVDIHRVVQDSLQARISSMPKHRREALLLGYLEKLNKNHAAIQVLCKSQLTREAAPVVRNQIELRLRGFILTSPYGNFAAELLFWHEDLRARLRFLQLAHLEHYADSPQALLPHTSAAQQNIILDIFAARPKPEAQEAFLVGWHAWTPERLFFELRKHLVESPRVTKELENMTQFCDEEDPSALLPGIRRYLLLDEELNYCRLHENLTEKPNAWTLSQAAWLDLLDDVQSTFDFGLTKDVENLRTELNAENFKATSTWI